MATLQDNWGLLRDKAKDRWGKLTDADFDQIEGEVDRLVGRIQKVYGRSREDVERDIQEFAEEFGCAFEQSQRQRRPSGDAESGLRGSPNAGSASRERPELDGSGRPEPRLLAEPRQQPASLFSTYEDGSDETAGEPPDPDTD